MLGIARNLPHFIVQHSTESEQERPCQLRLQGKGPCHRTSPGSLPGAQQRVWRHRRPPWPAALLSAGPAQTPGAPFTVPPTVTPGHPRRVHCRAQSHVRPVTTKHLAVESRVQLCSTGGGRGIISALLLRPIPSHHFIFIRERSEAELPPPGPGSPVSCPRRAMLALPLSPPREGSDGGRLLENSRGSRTPATPPTSPGPQGQNVP